MNKQRRKEIQEAIARIEDLTSDVEMILSDEQDAFDNMPEGLQFSYNGETSEEAISLLEDAVESLEEAKECLESID